MDLGEYLLVCSLLHVRYVDSCLISLLNGRLIGSALGTFWIVDGTAMIPSYGVGTNYSPTGNSLEGMQTPEFMATTGSSSSSPHIRLKLILFDQGFYYVILAVITFVYLICSIRTNACLFLALLLLVITFALFAAVYFQLALGNALLAAKLQKVRDNTSSSVESNDLEMIADYLFV